MGEVGKHFFMYIAHAIWSKYILYRKLTIILGTIFETEKVRELNDYCVNMPTCT